MLLTIGYQYITPEVLRARAKALNAVVIDVRSSVKRTKAGFGSRQLQQLLGDGGYVHRPDLGGRGDGPTGEAMGWLIGTVAVEEMKGRNVIVMCQEGAPGECHRHHKIAWPRYPDALHIFDPGEGDEAVEVFTARELDGAISGEGTYAMVGWADFLASQGLTDAPLPPQGLSVAPCVARAVVQPAGPEQADDAPEAPSEGGRNPRLARRRERWEAAARVAARRAQVTP